MLGRRIPEGNGGIPHLRRELVERPRVIRLLTEVVDYPVTVVKAGAGYGKSTAVSATLQASDHPVRWLTLTTEELEPTRLVAEVLQLVLPETVPDDEVSRVLDASTHPLTWKISAVWAAELANQYSVQESIIVLDDFHLLDDQPAIMNWIDSFLRKLPFHLHIVLITRIHPGLPYLSQLDLRGDILSVRERDLAFTRDEMERLFCGNKEMDVEFLTVEQLDWLLQKTTGMAMVLSLLWRVWKQSGSFELLQTFLEKRTTVRDQIGTLFCAELADEVLTFFIRSSVLTFLEPNICAAVTGHQDCHGLLRTSERKGLLVFTEDGIHYALHPLVREYLQAQLSPDDRRLRLWTAIRWYQERKQHARAIGLVYTLEDWDEIRSEILRYIPDYLSTGQVSTVGGWLERLPEHVVLNSSDLLHAKAEIARLTNSFQDAIRLYEQTERSAESLGDHRMQALSHAGRARLFLDTTQPASATHHIRRARQLLRGEDRDLRLALLQLAHENAINLGKVLRAGRLQSVLLALPDASLPKNNSDARLLLRTGRLAEAIALLRQRKGEDERSRRTALSHREGTLLLSLLHSMSGEVQQAKADAREGATLGEFFHSPFVRAVGYIRLGHALHLDDPLSDDARRFYQSAVDLMDEMAVSRGKAEAMLGMTLVHGYRGQFEMARAHSAEATEIANRAGDVWMATMVEQAYGQACFQASRFEEAEQVFDRCVHKFLVCSDRFLHLSSLLWRALSRHRLAHPGAEDDMLAAIDIAFSQHDEFLFLRPTLFGLRDVQMAVPLLLQCRSRSARDWVDQLLEHLGVRDALTYPGYTLRVQTLGEFRVWRGFTEIGRKEWQREKAKQLFQFLLTRRGQLMHREEIAIHLWDEADPGTAERDFKVALNGLSTALDPHKAERGTTAFVHRRGSSYMLAALPILSVDRDRFVEAVERASQSVSKTEQRAWLQRAYDLYRGEYLPENRYDPWTELERDRLRGLFLHAAASLAEILLGDQAYGDVISVCDRVLQIEPVLETAYALSMKAYAALGQRSMVNKLYQTCVKALRDELGIDVMPGTHSLYLELMNMSQEIPPEHSPGDSRRGNVSRRR